MIKVVVPIVVLVGLALIAWLIWSNPPTAQRGGPPPGAQTVVDVITIEPRTHQIKVSSYGRVQPRTQSFLVAQVSGQIVEVSPDYRPGGFFKKGEVLARSKSNNRPMWRAIAEAAVMNARQAQAQELARAEQAKIDWERLGEAGETPSDLVLRRPQLLAAEAQLHSARSNLAKAKLRLERTAITAPFDGRVLRQLADLGQVVGGTAQVAEVYATDYVEVRLPLRSTDLSFVTLPENTDAPLPVVFRSELGVATRWAGHIVRTEGAIDEVSRQLHVVAQIDDPFVARDGQRPLKIGEYVTAEITGTEFLGAIVIPAATVYQNTYDYVVEEGVVVRRPIEIAWQDGVQAIVSTGLESGEQLVTTPLGQVPSGTRVRVNGARP